MKIIAKKKNRLKKKEENDSTFNIYSVGFKWARSRGERQGHRREG